MATVHRIDRLESGKRKASNQWYSPVHRAQPVRSSGTGDKHRLSAPTRTAQNRAERYTTEAGSGARTRPFRWLLCLTPTATPSVRPEDGKSDPGWAEQRSRAEDEGGRQGKAREEWRVSQRRDETTRTEREERRGEARRD
ncbi:hypothetical protein AXG93_2789s1040 [Marchantia polymorpha subsp. ruderalis]|uniref:Uncharacterized protein n=1 Tax=Marchantia polymorpha subsp. ruderalis TaxID=1480154 RepID=A0A176W867_MARPO|nr:hypothetical protein AXG93_2789s1040 [Marchantia polymorpha subsp. ruderalis]